MTDKVLFLSELSEVDDFETMSGAVLCFGHFNTIHPGHIRYFLTAGQYGASVVVALEGDAQLPVAERDRFFGEEERAQSVAALNMVDHVVILDNASLEHLVRHLKPVALILGKEFEHLDASRVSLAVDELRAQGGDVVYDAGEPHYASAELFHYSLGDLEKERLRMFQSAQEAQGVKLSEVFDVFSRGRQPRLLVVGDTIVDHFVACDPLGMSNEAPVVVVKELETQNYVGGAGIVAAHVAALGARCTFLSVTGADEPAKFVASKLTDFGVDTQLLEDSSRPTTFKIRYLVDNQKLFRVSRLKEHKIAGQIEDRLIATIVDMAPDTDGILVSDFVYGVITPRVLETLRSVSLQHNLPLFGDLQCSSQVGNISKFQHFHLITPTEREARVALSNHDDGIEYVANLLIGKTHASNLILKLGAAGFIAYVNDDRNDFLMRQHFPALTVNPVDVTGAGDALLASMSVGLARGLSLMQASALACCVSAIAVQTIGNIPVRLEQAKKLFLLNQMD